MLKKIMLSGSLAALFAGSLIASEFSKAQAQVKARYPKEFAQIQTLAATDMAAAQKKLFELAGKANIRLPDSSSQTGRFQRGGRNMDFRGGRQGRFGRQGRGGMGMGMMRMGQFNLLKRFVAESQIRSKFASEYAAADKQLLEAVTKIEELAKKAKVTLPLSTELQIRKLRAKAPKEFAALEEQSTSDPRRIFGSLRTLADQHKIPLFEQNGNSRGQMRTPAGPPPGTKRENPNALLRRLRKKYPQEMKEIMALRDSDPRAFARKIRELDAREKRERHRGK